MQNTRNLLWIIPLSLFVSSPIWKPTATAFLTPRGGYDATLAAQANQQQQNFIMDAITITLTNKGKKEWVINAKRAFTGKTDKELGMIDIDALYTGKENPMTVTSNRGTYLVNERHLTLIDNVIIKKPKTGEELYTDLLHYYDATKMATSPVAVDIKGPKFSLQAGRMDYDLSTNGYDFNERVHVEL